MYIVHCTCTWTSHSLQSGQRTWRHEYASSWRRPSPRLSVRACVREHRAPAPTNMCQLASVRTTSTAVNSENRAEAHIDAGRFEHLCVLHCAVDRLEHANFTGDRQAAGERALANCTQANEHYVRVNVETSNHSRDSSAVTRMALKRLARHQLRLRATHRVAARDPTRPAGKRRSGRASRCPADSRDWDRWRPDGVCRPPAPTRTTPASATRGKLRETRTDTRHRGLCPQETKSPLG